MLDKGPPKTEPTTAAAIGTDGSSVCTGPSNNKQEDPRDGEKEPNNSRIASDRAQDAVPKFRNKRRTAAKPHIPPGEFPCKLRRADPRYWWGSVSSKTVTTPATAPGACADQRPNGSTSSLSSVSSESSMSVESASSIVTVEWVRPPKGVSAPSTK